MASNSNASYATPPRSDDGDDGIEKNATRLSLEPSSESQAPVFNPMFVTNDEPEPPPSDTDSMPSHNMQLTIDASEKRAMALDNIEQVLTSEMDQNAIEVLAATTFETYWCKGKTGYKRTNYLKEIKEGAEEAAVQWRISNADALEAKLAHQRARFNPASYIAGRHAKHMASTEMESRREIRHAEEANYEAHVLKAERLVAERRVKDAEAKQEAVRQEARNEESEAGAEGPRIGTKVSGQSGQG